MLSWLKALLRRPMSEADLTELASLTETPFPQPLYDSLAQLRSASGQSTLDFWRESFKKVIRRIASEASWEQQRVGILKEIVQEQDWPALSKAAETTPNSEAWFSQMRSAYPALEEASEEVRHRILFQRYLLARATIAVLITIGERLYAVDKIKRVELEIAEALQNDIRGFQAATAELLFVQTEEEAPEFEQLYDNEILPLLNDHWTLLALLQEEVIHSGVDNKKIRDRLSELAQRKEGLRARLASLHAKVDDKLPVRADLDQSLDA